MMAPLDIFTQEAEEHLQTMEEALLALDLAQADKSLVDQIFRAIHTIKGSSGMVGLDHLSGFTHHLENLLDEIRSDKRQFTLSIVSFFLLAKDHIQMLLAHTDVPNDLVAISDSLLAQLNKITNVSADTPNTPDTPDIAATAANGIVVESEPVISGYYAICIQAHKDTFNEGFDVLPIIRELHDLGDANTFGALHPMLDEHSATDCRYICLILLHTNSPLEMINDVFMFVGDDWTISVDAFSTVDDYNHIRAHLNALHAADLTTFIQKPGAIQGLLSLVKTNSHDKDSSSKKQILDTPRADDSSFVKVPTSKLDLLMSLVGELVIVKAKLDELVPALNNDLLNEVSEEFSRLTHDLRDNAFDIRMLPIGTIFTRFKRVVRDISDNLGKRVELHMSGEETELDKVVLDRLSDPLIHIIRNSLDHGIESPEQRLVQGKPEAGKIFIRAGHKDGFVLIQIEDDGAGLNVQKILQKARQKNLVAEDAKLDDNDIFNLIFEPGFSTADAVTDVSGRGVGMDVVRTSISKLQGRIVIDSELGKGTCLNIYLPMTLAIIEGLSVRVGDEHFVIPLNLVEECIETVAKENRSKDGGVLIEHRGKLISTINLHDTFNIARDATGIEQTVIVKDADSLIGITVDEVVGQSQTVIKSLGQLYTKTPGFMGATIMGNGRVAMIIDISQLAVDARANIVNIH